MLAGGGASSALLIPNCIPCRTVVWGPVLKNQKNLFEDFRFHVLKSVLEAILPEENDFLPRNRPLKMPCRCVQTGVYLD